MPSFFRRFSILKRSDSSCKQSKTDTKKSSQNQQALNHNHHRNSRREDIGYDVNQEVGRRNRSSISNSFPTASYSTSPRVLNSAATTISSVSSISVYMTDGVSSGSTIESPSASVQNVELLNTKENCVPTDYTYTLPPPLQPLAQTQYQSRTQESKAKHDSMSSLSNTFHSHSRSTPTLQGVEPFGSDENQIRHHRSGLLSPASTLDYFGPGKKHASTGSFGSNPHRVTENFISGTPSSQSNTATRNKGASSKPTSLLLQREDNKPYQPKSARWSNRGGIGSKEMMLGLETAGVFVPSNGQRLRAEFVYRTVISSMIALMIDQDRCDLYPIQFLRIDTVAGLLLNLLSQMSNPVIPYAIMEHYFKMGATVVRSPILSTTPMPVSSSSHRRETTPYPIESSLPIIPTMHPGGTSQTSLSWAREHFDLPAFLDALPSMNRVILLEVLHLCQESLEHQIWNRVSFSRLVQQIAPALFSTVFDHKILETMTGSHRCSIHGDTISPVEGSRAENHLFSVILVRFLYLTAHSSFNKSPNFGEEAAIVQGKTEPVDKRISKPLKPTIYSHNNGSEFRKSQEKLQQEQQEYHEKVARSYQEMEIQNVSIQHFGVYSESQKQQQRQQLEQLKQLEAIAANRSQERIIPYIAIAVVQATPTDLLDSLIRRYLKDDLAVRNYVSFVLEAIINHQLLHDRTAVGQAENQSNLHKIWTQRVRALLESQQPGARWAGVCFVRITVQQSLSMFNDHAKTWVTLLVGMLTPIIFRALTQSVTLYPTTFRLAVDKTEALCVTYMDGRFDMEPNLIKEAATCFSALHFAGGKNPNHPTERFTPSEQWRNNAQELIKAMHRCLNVLFCTIDEDKPDQTEISSKNKHLGNMPAPAEDFVQRYPQLFGRFSSLSKALIACLTCPTKEAVHLPLNSIIALLTRVYNVNTKTPASDARGVDQQEYFILISGVSSLHLASNEVLKTLLAMAQDHLVRHISHLATIAIKSIRHASGASSILKTSTYSIVESCIQAFGMPFVSMIQVPLMKAILEDLRMPTAKIVNPLEIGTGGINLNSRANNQNNGTKHKGGAGKNRRTGGANQAQPSLEDIVPTSVFVAASNVLSLVLTTLGPNLAPHTRAAADTLIVTHLLNSQHHVNPIGNSDAPFYTASVRAHLYKVLTSSISSPAETQSGLVPLSVGIFKAGLNDPEKYVRDSCISALTICDLIMHARLPPMQRARTAAPNSATKGDRPVEDTGSTLFGALEAPKSSSNNTGMEDSESEEEESENEGDNNDDDDDESEEEDEDIQMKDRVTESIVPTHTISMAGFKAAGEKIIDNETTISSTSTSRVTEESSSATRNVHEVTTKIVSMSEGHIRESIDATGVGKTPSVDMGTVQVTTTITSSSLSQANTNDSISHGYLNGNDDEEDFAIPEINMDDDDDDMDSD
ncbi:Proline-, glutamic acid- and leucine-rich protein 1 [Entomortierella beljakovae]|nr:Proline-, glutamic acid- and leucine-rich protein 1 [Entomortierella beljakovae]